MMRKRTCVVLLSIALMSTASTTVFAAGTPSPQPNSSANPAKQTLTQAQKAAIAAARSAFALAKSNAQNGFDRALADAQAIRDQAIMAAGNDQNAIRIAKKNYRDSYKIILHAYRADLNTAKSILQNALASAMGHSVSH